MDIHERALQNPEQVFDCGFCPFCGAVCTKIVKTEKPVRHHKCLSCGCTWRSISIVLAYEGALKEAASLHEEKIALENAVSFF